MEEKKTQLNVCDSKSFAFAFFDPSQATSLLFILNIKLKSHLRLLLFESELACDDKEAAIRCGITHNKHPRCFLSCRNLHTQSSVDFRVAFFSFVDDVDDTPKTLMCGAM